MITIRYATTADAHLVAEMSRETFYETFAAQNTKEDMDQFMNEVFTYDRLVEEVGTPNNIFLLAYDGTEAVGYARIREHNNPPELNSQNALEIARIYAATNAIGKGVGRALMQRCIDIAVEKKVDWIWLGVWEHNQRAIGFYSKWGFEKFSDHIFMLGNDPQTDWLMKKRIVL